MQGQWRQIMGSNPSYFSSCGDNCPVEQVSWNDAQDFIRRLNSQSGKRYRLPTEAEWEYAARSGGKSKKWAGASSESSLGDYAWYGSNSGGKTHPAGQKLPNGLGLHDMSGNVWEWCNDWYDGTYYNQSPRDNPGGPSSGSSRVLRGGSWFNAVVRARAAIRYGIVPVDRFSRMGFRLALPPGQ
jgi:formylglycine-generating enzyme required for sulfatase activity